MNGRKETRKHRKEKIQYGGLRVSPEFTIGLFGIPIIPIPIPYLDGHIKVGTSGGGNRKNRSNRSNRKNRSSRSSSRKNRSNRSNRKA